MNQTRPKVLFVDDDPALRRTIPLILEQQGFAVAAAADVTSAIELITKQAFDVLVSDLNMGEVSDGFTVVSAMRKLQPKCRTLILTGFPDFQGALDRLLGQADGYILKPARPDALATRIRQQLSEPDPRPATKHKNLAELLLECKQKLLDSWKECVAQDPLLARPALSEQDRMDNVPAVLDEVIAALKAHRRTAQNHDEMRLRASEAAREHGIKRQQQGFTLEQLFKEIRLLQCCLFDLAQQNLLDLDVSALIPELTLASDTIEVMVAASIQAFVDAKASRTAEETHSAA